MFLKDLPLVFVLAGLVLYTVLAGADFGAGMWRLLAGGGERGEHVRDHAHHSMGPVWEANHVWLIFVITVAWTAYPTFVGSVASTLAAPFFIAALGIILRGASYALRSGASTSRESRMVDSAFAVGSLITPFALGAMAGAIAAERVPVGNAAGGLFSSWLSPVPILIGLLAVAFSAYLAAVYLAADAVRHGDAELEEAYRVRALGAGALAGMLAVVGLIVLHADAHSLYTELLHGAALAVLIVSLLAGAAALGLVATRRFEPARYVAALAVAAVVAGWAFARYPVLLPGLTVGQAAAPHDTLVAVVIAVLAGGAILFPSLALLFGLLLRGRLGEPGGPDPTAADAGGVGVAALVHPPHSTPLQARVAVALLIAGVGFLTAADAGWAHFIGVFALFGFIIVGFAAIVPGALADDGDVNDQLGKAGPRG
ncbi:MAG TPA: cytochrome d ubiquinol oxidase subunit II [Solirubrobacteraceae bacterium]|jgi:cytochrome d ubiquinol oxidase subunit II